MIFLFVVNILCYLLLCSMVFFPFRDKWYLDDRQNIEEDLNTDETMEGADKGNSEMGWKGEKGKQVALSKAEKKLREEDEKSVNCDKSGMTMIKKCFELMTAVDYLNIDDEAQEHYRPKPPEKKTSNSMFEELVKCLEGKTRTDFFTWGDVLSGRKDSVEILLSRGFSVNGTDKEGDSLLHYTCRVGDKETATRLMDKGAKMIPNKRMEVPLHLAVSNSNVELCQVLLQSGCNPNLADSQGFTSLHLASKSPDAILVSLLLDHGADSTVITKSCLRPVHLAVKNVDILKLLLDRNNDLNSTAKDGSTPLHFAARGNCLESMDLLLKRSAQINVKDENGSTPLLVQCKNFSFYSDDNAKCFDCVKLLLDRGACVNVRDHSGATPLHFASENELVDIMELLLEFGANPNVVSEIGDSPLHIAVRNQSLETVYTLLEWGADVNTAGALGETPLDIAAQSLLLFNVWNYSSEVLIKHVGKLVSAGIPFPQSDALSTLNRKMSTEFLRRCSEEKMRLSSKPLAHPVSLLNILTAHEGNLTKYLRNVSVEELFKRGDYIDDFPMYSSLLTLRFRWGYERNYLQRKCFKRLSFVTPHLPQLPFDCFENLCKFLKLPDLRALAHACQLDNRSKCDICWGTLTLPKQRVSQPPGAKRFHLIKILNY